MKKLVITILLTAFVCNIIQAQQNDNIRQVIQSKLDSLTAPLEEQTQAKFGLAVEFKFNQPYQGIMKKDGSLYTRSLNNYDYKAGDSILLIGVNIKGLSSIILKKPNDEILYYKSKSDINETIALEDESKFWEHVATIEAVDKMPLIPYCGALDCISADGSDSEKYWILNDKSSLCFKLDQDLAKTTMSFELKMTYGEAFRGLGCAIPNESYVEFTFENGSSLKKIHSGEKSCDRLSFDITEDLSKFKQGVDKITISLSIKETSFNLVDAMNKNLINLKLDCIKS